MSAVMDLWIRHEKDATTMRRTQENARGDILVTTVGGNGSATESITFSAEEDFAVWNSLVADLLGRDLAHNIHSNIELAQLGDTDPRLYVDGQPFAELKFTRAQLTEKMPKVIFSS